MGLWIFIGDRFVDNEGEDVSRLLQREEEKAKVAWPVRVMHAPCHRYLDTEIVEQDGPEYVEFVADNYGELEAHQLDKW